MVFETEAVRRRQVRTVENKEMNRHRQRGPHGETEGRSRRRETRRRGEEGEFGAEEAADYCDADVQPRTAGLLLKQVGAAAGACTSATALDCGGDEMALFTLQTTIIYTPSTYPALSSLQQPMLVSPGSAMRWSRRVKLKSPGTVNTSVTPICTCRRAMWRPRVASEELTVEGAVLWIAEAAPFGRLPTSVHEGFQTSREPILVSMGF